MTEHSTGSARRRGSRMASPIQPVSENVDIRLWIPRCDVLESEFQIHVNVHEAISIAETLKASILNDREFRTQLRLILARRCVLVHCRTQIPTDGSAESGRIRQAIGNAFDSFVANQSEPEECLWQTGELVRIEVELPVEIVLSDTSAEFASVELYNHPAINDIIEIRKQAQGIGGEDLATKARTELLELLDFWYREWLAKVKHDVQDLHSPIDNCRSCAIRFVKGEADAPDANLVVLAESPGSLLERCARDILNAGDGAIHRPTSSAEKLLAQLCDRYKVEVQLHVDNIELEETLIRLLLKFQIDSCAAAAGISAMDSSPGNLEQLGNRFSISHKSHRWRWGPRWQLITTLEALEYQSESCNHEQVEHTLDTNIESHPTLPLATLSTDELLEKVTELRKRTSAERRNIQETSNALKEKEILIALEMKHVLEGLKDIVTKDWTTSQRKSFVSDVRFVCKTLGLKVGFKKDDAKAGTLVSNDPHWRIEYTIPARGKKRSRTTTVGVKEGSDRKTIPRLVFHNSNS